MVTVSNVDPKSIEFIYRVLEIPWKLLHPKQLHSQRALRLVFSGRQRVREFLTHLLPVLVLKKEQAKIMLQLMEQHKFRYWSLSDWELVLRHAKANRANKLSRRLQRMKKLEQFIEKLRNNINRISG